MHEAEGDRRADPQLPHHFTCVLAHLGLRILHAREQVFAAFVKQLAFARERQAPGGALQQAHA